ncbi:MAG: MBL fold metallo-hydrolase [Rhodocyclaceae bacterium]
MTQTTGMYYPLQHPPAPGSALEVAPGVHWLRMPLPFQLNHINVWLLEDGDGWTIVDCGIAIEAVRAQWEEAFAGLLGGRPVKQLIVTHFHPDHLGLAQWLAERWNTRVMMTQGEFLVAELVWHQIDGYGIPAMVEQFRRHGLDEARIEALLARGNAYALGVPALPVDFTRILDGDDIQIGGKSWRVMVGYGHSPEHAALYCDALGVLISGDMVLPGISTNVSVVAANPDANSLKLFLDSLSRYATLPTQTLVLPSHGRPFRGLSHRVDQLHIHHYERCDALLAASSEPQTAWQLVPTLFPRELDTHQTMFAMGEAIAHLNYLEQARAIARVEGNGITQYVKLH